MPYSIEQQKQRCRAAMSIKRLQFVAFLFYEVTRFVSHSNIFFYVRATTSNKVTPDGWIRDLAFI